MAGLVRTLGRILSDLLNSSRAPERSAPVSDRRSPESRRPRPEDRRRDEPRTDHNSPPPGFSYPGDYAGMPQVTYAPRNDDRADPGEVVWTWVPYEEDHSRGKDRPVLIVGWDGGGWLLGLQLTSQDHDRDARQEAAAGRYWFDVGTGDWDKSGRASEARVNRVVRVDPAHVRRTGGRLPERTFGHVVAEMRRHLR
jgi:hypothetical protein